MAKATALFKKYLNRQPYPDTEANGTTDHYRQIGVFVNPFDHHYILRDFSESGTASMRLQAQDEQTQKNPNRSGDNKSRIKFFVIIKP